MDLDLNYALQGKNGKNGFGSRLHFSALPTFLPCNALKCNLLLEYLIVFIGVE